ncbi:MAG: hypothetical protein KatS3mg060_3360 [Dehalococcoidia bacterium]|nr:MAG: hypothetical protein KatS3mg060_3360 [Dehalococcoidia bacterium]
MIAPPRANPPRSISGTFRFAGLLLLVLLSLVGSGASSLVYQVAWFRELGVIFGVTVQATSAVLASFMAGLALGSLAAARIVPRLRNPFLIYGLIELGIGLTGFASLAALAVLQPLTRELVLTLGDQPTMLGLLRFALAFTILLIPTTLMGATLPVLLSAPVLREREHGATIGLIYAANTFGAIAGALTAGFILIGQYGLTVTVALAAGVNTGVGLVWLVAAGYTRRAPAGEAPTPPTGTPAYPPAVTTAVLVSYALSGGIALAYEVVWTRLLAGIFPGSVYAFAVMLSAILGGIAVGSWLITPLMNRQLSWPLVYVVLQLGMALTALLSLHILGQAYGIEAAVRARLAPDEGLLLGEPWYMALFSMLAIGPVALLMGVTFPVAARIFTVGQAQVGRRLGVIYGANVLGGLAGSLAGGLIVIPAVGAHGAIALLAVLNAIAGAVVLLVLPLASIGSGGVRVVLRLGIAAALVAAPAVASATPADFYETLFAQHPARRAASLVPRGTGRHRADLSRR